MRTITVNCDFTQWNVSTGYITSTPSIADVQQECYKRSSANIADGLAWHVNEYWSTIEEYRRLLPSLGISSSLLPATPQEMVELLMEFLSKPFTEAYMIHNAGNENENPRSQTVLAEFEEGVKKLCLNQVKKTVGDDADEEDLDDTADFLKGMLMRYIKPTLTSMLTDTNQASDATLTSRTNDLQVVLTIPKPTNK